MKDLAILLLKELKPYRRTIVWTTLLSLLAAGLNTLGPVFLGRALDAAGAGGSIAAIFGMLAVWFGARAVGDLLLSHVGKVGNLIGNRAADGYVRRQATALFFKPLSFHYGKKGQEVSDALHEMRWNMENLIVGTVFDLLASIFAMLAILGYLTWLDWRTAAALCVSVLALAGFTVHTTPKSMRLQDAWFKARRKGSGVAWDALRNVLVVKSSTSEDQTIRHVEKLAAEAQPLVERDYGYDEHVRNGQNAIVAAGTAAAIAFAVQRVSAGRMTAGQLTSVLAYAFAVFGYIRYLQWQVRTFIRLNTSYRSVRDLALEPDEDYSSGAAVDLRGGVEFRNVRFRYREDKPALEDVSFRVDPGERVAIVGESGEGKTTLVDLLGRYYLPQSGEIRFDDRASGEIALRSLRSQMAYVPQDLTLFHETISYNIRYGRPDASDEDVRRAARQAALEDFIEGLPDKWETMVGERGLKLSGGERQRVALARAFLRDPRILVLDEPTAHLDSVTEGKIQRALEDLMKGRTTFIIAHRLRTVMDADCILVLKDGRIVETGTHAELAARGGTYTALLKAQSGFIAPDEPHLGEPKMA